MDAQNPYAAPRSSTAKVADLPPGEAAWREGKLLVVDHGTELPPLCIKCGVETIDRAKKVKLIRYPWRTYVGLLLGVIPFLLLVIITQRRATIFAHICDYHRARRRNIILGSWIGVLLGCGVIIFAGGSRDDTAAVFFVLGILLVLGSVIVGITMSQLLTPSRIVKGRAWLRGASPEFLATLPEFPL